MLMSRRIDIELTSSREDGSWTWRAAGAKQPKGVLDGALLPDGAAVGDELRADVDTSLDGTDVLAVLPPKGKAHREPERIEIIAKAVKDDELVTQTLAKRGRGDRPDRGDRGDRRDRPPRRDGDRPRGDGRPAGRSGGPGGDRSGGPRGERPPRGDRPAGDRPSGDRSDRPRREPPTAPVKPKPKRLRPGRAHRKVALDALAPEVQVIAEHVLRGGVPAVRQAVDKMNEEAKAAGRPEVNPEALIAVAERLLPALRAAEWWDRAEAAVADLKELDLRDLRSVVVAAETGAKDDESRALAAQLREGLALRVDEEQNAWLADIAETLGDGRIVRALRLSSRPPKAGAPLPADMAAKLSDAASAALTAETVTDRWTTVLDALSFSPVRLTVVPASKPETPSSELIAAVTRVAGRIPKVAEAFGIEAPTESARRRESRSGRKPGTSGGRPPKGAKPGPDGGAPIPPPPPIQAEPSDPVAATVPSPTPIAESEPPNAAVDASISGASPESVEAGEPPSETAPTADTDPPAPAESTEVISAPAETSLEPMPEPMLESPAGVAADAPVVDSPAAGA